jgi:hypothetical protein
MAIYTPTSPSNPNPTIGNPFNTEATVLDTLLTSLKADFTGYDNYFTTTGLENAYIADQAVQSPQFQPQAGDGIFQSSNTDIPDSAGGGPVIISDEIAITTTFNDAKVMWNYAIRLTWSSGAASNVFHYLERSSTSGFGAGTGTIIAPSGGSTPIVKQESRSSSVSLYTGQPVVDTLATAGTYYYHFTALDQITDKICEADGNQSFYTYFVTHDFS